MLSVEYSCGVSTEPEGPPFAPLKIKFDKIFKA